MSSSADHHDLYPDLHDTSARFDKTLTNVHSGLQVTQNCRAYDNGSLSGECHKVSPLCVGHETKHGFRSVVCLAICDEGSPGCSIKPNLITEPLFDLAVVFDDEG